GFECHETTISPKTLLSADEVFLSSTAGGLVPVTRLDNVPVSSGSVGEMTLQLKQSYWDKRLEGWHGTPVDDEN
ncbi:MAG: branched-chain amino acid transferase, partial [SAR324 cluster bacterium]|nr:branched-chain amino acid transferase [SAR324 cluster bacterium]